MAPPLPVDRLVRLVLTATHENSQRISVFHFQTLTPHTWTAPELLTLATNFWNAVRVQAKATCGTGVNFVSVVATDLGQYPNVQAVYNIPQPEPGVQVGDTLPANVAACISWKTPFANRSTRGRTYWYGMIDTAANGSNWTNTFLTTLGTFAQAILTFTNTGGVASFLTIYSRVGHTTTPVSTFLIDNVVDSQRRRLPLRGA